MIIAGERDYACSHCNGTGKCPFPFCIRCERGGDVPEAGLSPGDCLACVGMGAIPGGPS